MLGIKTDILFWNKLIMKKMEYWNMHTYSNKLIEFEKISLLKDKNEYSASKILANLIKNNILYVKENLPFLYEYYIYFYN